MNILTVGPGSTYANIPAALAVATGGDQISLEAGYSNKHAVIDVEDLFVKGTPSSTGIELKLGGGVSNLTLLGGAPINVSDNAGANTITGNAGANVIAVSAGGDVVHGGLGDDRLVVDYSTVTASVIGTTVSVSDGGIHSVTFDGIENVTIDTGSGNDTITAADGVNILTTRAGNDTITSGDGDNLIYAGIGNDTVTTGDGGGHVFGGEGDDILTTGDGQDFVRAGLGNDTIVSGGGDDFIFSRGGIDTADAGPGNDRLVLDYSSSTTNVGGGVGGGNLAQGYSGTVADVAGTSSMDFSFIESFKITTGSGNDNILTGAGDDSLTGNAGHDTLNGGAGTDHIRGGAGNDVLIGGIGVDDVLAGGRGLDSFRYGNVSESTGAGHDLINGFNAHADRFDFNIAVTGIDAHVTHGHLDDATFNGDLHAAMNGGALKANHAVLFTPDSGANAGNLYVVVDANGVAGFQAGQDYVIEIANGHHMADLSVADFI